MKRYAILLLYCALQALDRIRRIRFRTASFALDQISAAGAEARHTVGHAGTRIFSLRANFEHALIYQIITGVTPCTRRCLSAIIRSAGRAMRRATGFSVTAGVRTVRHDNRFSVADRYSLISRVPVRFAGQSVRVIRCVRIGVRSTDAGLQIDSAGRIRYRISRLNASTVAKRKAVVTSRASRMISCCTSVTYRAVCRTVGDLITANVFAVRGYNHLIGRFPHIRSVACREVGVGASHTGCCPRCVCCGMRIVDRRLQTDGSEHIRYGVTVRGRVFLDSRLAGEVRGVARIGIRNQRMDVPTGRATVTASQRILRADFFSTVVQSTRTVVVESVAAQSSAFRLIVVLDSRLAGEVRGAARSRIRYKITEFPTGRATVAAIQRILRADFFLSVVLVTRTVVVESVAAQSLTFRLIVVLDSRLAGVVRSVDQILDVPTGRAAVAASQRILRADFFSAVVLGPRTVVVEVRTAQSLAFRFVSALDSALASVVRRLIGLRILNQILDVPTRRAGVAARLCVLRADFFLSVVLGPRTIVMVAGTAQSVTFDFVAGLFSPLAGVVRRQTVLLVCHHIEEVPTRRAVVAAIIRIARANAFLSHIVALGSRTIIEVFVAVSRIHEVADLTAQSVFVFVLYGVLTGVIRSVDQISEFPITGSRAGITAGVFITGADQFLTVVLCPRTIVEETRTAQVHALRISFVRRNLFTFSVALYLIFGFTNFAFARRVIAGLTIRITVFEN